MTSNAGCSAIEEVGRDENTKNPLLRLLRIRISSDRAGAEKLELIDHCQGRLKRLQVNCPDFDVQERERIKRASKPKTLHGECTFGQLILNLKHK